MIDETKQKLIESDDWKITNAEDWLELEPHIKAYIQELKDKNAELITLLHSYGVHILKMFDRLSELQEDNGRIEQRGFNIGQQMEFDKDLEEWFPKYDEYEDYVKEQQNIFHQECVDLQYRLDKLDKYIK